MAETTEKLKPYSDEEVEAKIAEHGLDGWYLEDGWLRRKYNTDGWPSTLMAVNAVGYVCEAAYHHADLAVTWGKPWVKLMNHAGSALRSPGPFSAGIPKRSLRTSTSPSHNPGIMMRVTSRGTSSRRAIHSVVMSAATEIFMTATS